MENVACLQTTILGKADITDAFYFLLKNNLNLSKVPPTVTAAFFLAARLLIALLKQT